MTGGPCAYRSLSGNIPLAAWCRELWFRLCSRFILHHIDNPTTFNSPDLLRLILTPLRFAHRQNFRRPHPHYLIAAFRFRLRQARSTPRSSSAAPTTTHPTTFLSSAMALPKRIIKETERLMAEPYENPPIFAPFVMAHLTESLDNQQSSRDQRRSTR